MISLHALLAADPTAVSFVSLQGLLDGLTVGLIYVLLAAGLSVIFGVMHVINFAHGELFTLGAYFALALIAPLGGGYAFFAALLIAPLLVGVVGVAIERFTVRPLYGRDPLYHILLTFGLVLVINDLIYIVWGTGNRSFTRPEVVRGTFDLAGFTFSAYNVFIIVFGSLVALAVWAALEYTRYGLIIRAGSQDRQMVRNLGIDIDRYYSLVFGAGAALAAIAGITIGGTQQVSPEMGMGFIIPAFVIVVLGGLGSFKGAVVGGLLVGILQETIIRPNVPSLEGIVIFLLMIGVLLVRPQGLFGSEAPENEGGALLTGTDGGFLDSDTRLKLGIVMVVLLVLVPFGSGWLYSGYAVTLVTRMLLWGLFALSLDFVMGYTGLVSLGHVLFWGLGGYVAAITLINVSESVFVAIGLAILLSAVAAWIVGYLSIRVAGVYFAMITLAFAELFHNVISDLDISGGSEGLFGFSAFYGIAGVGVDLTEIEVVLGPVILGGSSLFYYVVLAALVGSFFLTRRILNSPFGAVMKAIRENEQRATFLGYNTTVYKRRAFVISGVVAGLAGGLSALNSGIITPSATEWIKSGEVIVMVVLGGMGTLYGPILGAFVFFGLEAVLMDFIGERWRLVLGTVFVLFVIFLPRGLVSLPGQLRPLLSGGPGSKPTPDDTTPGGDD
ncbi:ABC transporter permease [Natronosalvus rutilus]|uniref:ABC transporter permease n=1 Tax=Natronosalvus rutilus TaxID=2953753 RepID=A0A9E7NEG2_9EURY|nr:ABC transporter permease [Natronosalvus rutilus]UTF55383.1 ABC transporter permease [Natronosalvus rutilus]